MHISKYTKIKYPTIDALKRVSPYYYDTIIAEEIDTILDYVERAPKGLFPVAEGALIISMLAKYCRHHFPLAKK